MAFLTLLLLLPQLADQNCTELHELGIVSRLVSLLSSQEKVIVAHSILCLAILSSHCKETWRKFLIRTVHVHVSLSLSLVVVKRALLRLPVVSPLLSLLKPEGESRDLSHDLSVDYDPRQQKNWSHSKEPLTSSLTYQVRLLVSVVTIRPRPFLDEYTFKQQLEEGGVCQLLIGLLTHSDCDVIRNVMKSLSLLTRYHKSRQSIDEANGKRDLCYRICHGSSIDNNYIFMYYCNVNLLLYKLVKANYYLHKIAIVQFCSYFLFFSPLLLFLLHSLLLFLGFPSLLALLSSEYAIIQDLTLQTLHNCLQDGK